MYYTSNQGLNSGVFGTFGTRSYFEIIFLCLLAAYLMVLPGILKRKRFIGPHLHPALKPHPAPETQPAPEFQGDKSE
jgi:hypothetical protein